MILVLLVSLYTTRVVLKNLGVEDYGIYNVVAGFVSMFSFLNVSMTNGIQRYYNYVIGKENESALGKAYSSALVIQTILAVIVLILLETIGLCFFYEKLVIPTNRQEVAFWLYQFSVISLILVILQVPYSASIIAHERMDFYAYLSILEVLLKLIIAILLTWFMGDKLLLYGLLMLIITALIALIYYLYAKAKFKTLILQKIKSWTLTKEMISFSGWNLLGTFSYMIKNQGLNILLNTFFGPIVNAARGVSSMVGSSIQGFQSNIVLSFRPQMVEAYAHGDNHRVLSLMFVLSKASYIMLFMLSVPIIIELPFILRIWLGDTIPDYTIPFTNLILINMIISSLNTPLSQVIHATGKMRNYQIGTSLIIFSILPISYIFLKIGFSPISVYVVSLVITIFNQYVCMILLKKEFNYSIYEYLKKVLLPLLFVSIIGLVSPLLLHYFLPESFFRVFLVALIAIIGTMLLTYLTSSRSEKELLINYVKKIKK